MPNICDLHKNTLGKYLQENFGEELGRVKQYEPLQPFTNDRFGERIMRERIKEKAQKGYSKYRLPTGETIGKIEGFGQERPWAYITERGGTDALTPQNLKVGQIVNQADETGNFAESQDWIITDIGKEVVDPQGNSWIEIDLRKEMGKEAIPAFGKANVGTILAGGAGTVGLAGLVKIAGSKEEDKPEKFQLTGAQKLHHANVKNKRILEGIKWAETGIVKGDPYKSWQYSDETETNRALGSYRITEAELKTYSKRYLNKQVTPAEFLNSPALQDKYMLNKLEYYQKQGKSLETILLIHNKGPNTHKTISDPEVSKYINKVKKYSFENIKL